MIVHNTEIGGSVQCVVAWTVFDVYVDAATRTALNDSHEASWNSGSLANSLNFSAQHLFSEPAKVEPRMQEHQMAEFFQES